MYFFEVSYLHFLAIDVILFIFIASSYGCVNSLLKASNEALTLLFETS